MQISSDSLGSFTFFLTLLAITPTPSDADPPGSNYIGCYVDTANDRVLSVWANGVNNQVSSMTNELCASECIGYNYFGTEYSTYCFCSNEIASGAALAPTSSTCNSACGGNENEYCGGFWLIDVYQLHATAAATTSDIYATAAAAPGDAPQITDSSLSPAAKGTIAGSVFGGVGVLIALIGLCLHLSQR